MVASIRYRHMPEIEIPPAVRGGLCSDPIEACGEIHEGGERDGKAAGNGVRDQYAVGKAAQLTLAAAARGACREDRG